MDYFDKKGQKEEVMKEVRNYVSSTDPNSTREYPVVSMLGTGGSRSSRTRNTSGILTETRLVYIFVTST